jgi:ATP-dependent Clp protease ATP-binding subunit ClpA
MKKKLINVQHIKLGALSTVLLLAIMLTTVDPSQSSVFAQNTTSTLNSVPITPALETSDDDSSSIDNYVQKQLSDATQELNSEANQESASYATQELISDATQELNSEATQESASNATQELISDATQEDASSSEKDIDETEDAKTNPLSDQIRERVAGQLNATSTQ